jgi:hypothetical protein
VRERERDGCRGALRRPALDPGPGRALHCTLGRVGVANAMRDGSHSAPVMSRPLLHFSRAGECGTTARGRGRADRSDVSPAGGRRVRARSRRTRTSHASLLGSMPAGIAGAGCTKTTSGVRALLAGLLWSLAPIGASRSGDVAIPPSRAVRSHPEFTTAPSAAPREGGTVQMMVSCRSCVRLHIVQLLAVVFVAFSACWAGTSRIDAPGKLSGCCIAHIATQE